MTGSGRSAKRTSEAATKMTEVMKMRKTNRKDRSVETERDSCLNMKKKKKKEEIRSDLVTEQKQGPTRVTGRGK